MSRLFNAMRRLAHVDATTHACRRCGAGIANDDYFGVSERVCAPCRRDYNRLP